MFEVPTVLSAKIWERWGGIDFGPEFKRTDAEDFHITVTYSPDCSEFEAGLILDAMIEMAARSANVEFTATHVEAFPFGDDGTPVVLRLDPKPSAQMFREDWLKALTARNLPFSTKWPEWKPHITLGYHSRDVKLALPLTKFEVIPKHVIVSMDKEGRREVRLRLG